MSLHYTLPPLPLQDWLATKKTLHRYIQIIGKIKLKLLPYKNHWWNVPLYVTSKGLTTMSMPYGNKLLQLDFDFCRHRLVISTSESEQEIIALTNGLCVSDFYRNVFESLSRLHMPVKILARPYGLEPDVPLAEDREHCSYQADKVHNFWQALCFVDVVFKEFSGKFVGKCSPVHLFWHSLDLTVTRFSGKRAPAGLYADKVNAESYSHEVISAGFWPGDDKVQEPAFYSYTSPSPPGIDSEVLLPRGKAKWIYDYGSPEALLPYELIRNSDDPKAEVMQFLESSFMAGAIKAGWNTSELLVTPHG